MLACGCLLAKMPCLSCRRSPRSYQRLRVLRGCVKVVERVRVSLEAVVVVVLHYYTEMAAMVSPHRGCSRRLLLALLPLSMAKRCLCPLPPPPPSLTIYTHTSLPAYPAPGTLFPMSGCGSRAGQTAVFPTTYRHQPPLLTTHQRLAFFLPHTHALTTPPPPLSTPSTGPTFPFVSSARVSAFRRLKLIHRHHYSSSQAPSSTKHHHHHHV